MDIFFVNLEINFTVPATCPPFVLCGSANKLPAEQKMFVGLAIIYVASARELIGDIATTNL